MDFEDVEKSRKDSKFEDMLDGEVKHEFKITNLIKNYTE